MKVFFTLALLIPIAACEIRRRYDGDKVYRLSPTTKDQWKLVQSLQDGPRDQFDVWGSASNRPGQMVDIRIGADSIAMFERLMQSANIESEIVINDVQQMIESVQRENDIAREEKAKAGTIVGTYPKFDDAMAWLDQMCGKYSALATCSNYGLSYYNRTLRYIKIGAENKNRLGPKKKIWMEGTMHAREWLSTATIIWIIDKVCIFY